MTSAAEAGLCCLSVSEKLNDAAASLRKLEGAEGSCELFLSGRFQELDQLLELLARDNYTLEAVTEVTLGGNAP